MRCEKLTYGCQPEMYPRPCDGATEFKVHDHGGVREGLWLYCGFHAHNAETRNRATVQPFGPQQKP